MKKEQKRCFNDDIINRIMIQVFKWNKNSENFLNSEIF